MNPQQTIATKSRLYVTLFLLLLICTLPLEAQSPLSKIIGTVKDSSGAVVAAAQVTATDEARGYTRSVITDAAGDYEINLLFQGSYAVTCELQGFKKFVR